MARSVLSPVFFIVLYKDDTTSANFLKRSPHVKLSYAVVTARKFRQEHFGRNTLTGTQWGDGLGLWWSNKDAE